MVDEEQYSLKYIFSTTINTYKQMSCEFIRNFFQIIAWQVPYVVVLFRKHTIYKELFNRIEYYKKYLVRFRRSSFYRKKNWVESS